VLFNAKEVTSCEVFWVQQFPDKETVWAYFWAKENIMHKKFYTLYLEPPASSQGICFNHFQKGGGLFEPFAPRRNGFMYF